MFSEELPPDILDIADWTNEVVAILFELSEVAGPFVINGVNPFKVI